MALQVIAPDGTTEFWGNSRVNGDHSNNIEKVCEKTILIFSGNLVSLTTNKISYYFMDAVGK